LRYPHPHLTREIDQAVAEAVSRIRVRALDESPDYLAAQLLVEELAQSGQLDDARVAAFAQEGLFAEITVALARMCEVPLALVERAMIQERLETVLIFARMIGLSWSTVRAILAPSRKADRPPG
jgi:hypothetical protein